MRGRKGRGYESGPEEMTIPTLEGNAMPEPQSTATPHDQDPIESRAYGRARVRAALAPYCRASELEEALNDVLRAAGLLLPRTLHALQEDQRKILEMLERITTPVYNVSIAQPTPDEYAAAMKKHLFGDRVDDDVSRETTTESLEGFSVEEVLQRLRGTDPLTQPSEHRWLFEELIGRETQRRSEVLESQAEVRRQLAEDLQNFGVSFKQTFGDIICRLDPSTMTVTRSIRGHNEIWLKPADLNALEAREMPRGEDV